MSLQRSSKVICNTLQILGLKSLQNPATTRSFHSTPNQFPLNATKNIISRGFEAKYLYGHDGISRNLHRLMALDKRGISTETLTSKWKETAKRLQLASTKTKLGALNLTRGMAANIPKQLTKPVGFAQGMFSRYRDAISLQVEGFWKRNSIFFLGLAGLVVCMLLWRTMIGMASFTIGLSEGLAKYGFLALATAMVCFAGLYLRARFTINPDKVYRLVMRKLNTSAGILEVLGAPLSGTDLRAYIMSGSRLRFKSFKPTISRKRCFLLFPIQGSERRGVVSVVVKKKKGQYDFKLLAVDIPMASGPDQRMFLIGDEEEYRVGGGLISELRDPMVMAMAAEKEFENQDEREDEYDKRKEREEAEKANKEKTENLS